MTSIAEQVVSGDRRVLARLLTGIENEREGAAQALADLFPHTGRAQITGITGAPGTGKSTLVTALATTYRQREKTVAILAVDPSSPFTGGAVLGDRIRMQSLYADDGVFIRSMATRGQLGGLARAAHAATQAFDAAGFDVILLETVGAGQSEVDVVTTAHTVIVVEAPGMGDGVQVIKAGVLEAADILAVNKADRPEAARTVRNLRGLLNARLTTGHHGANESALNKDKTEWQVPIIETIATEAKGIDELIDAIDSHRQTGLGMRRQERLLRGWFWREVEQQLRHEFETSIPSDSIDHLLDRVIDHEMSPREAATLALSKRNEH